MDNKTYTYYDIINFFEQTKQRVGMLHDELVEFKTTEDFDELDEEAQTIYNADVSFSETNVEMIEQFLKILLGGVARYTESRPSKIFNPKTNGVIH